MTPDEQKEKTRKYNAEYRLKNADRLRTLRLATYAKNRHAISARAKEWRRQNPDKHWQTRKAYVGTPAGRMSVVKASAKTRQIPYELCDQDALRILKLSCYYCGDTKQVGIDRVDSNEGYRTDNCLPCCGMCNYMKRTYSKEDFLAQCRKIVEHHT